MWCYLFFKILQNEICKLTRNLPLASFGSETVKTPSQPIICRTGPSFSKAGYHVFLDKSLANTEHNKKNDYPDTCPGHSDLSGGYHYPPFWTTGA